MQSWNAFFRRLPVQLHDCIALCLSTGAEVVLQCIVRLDDDVMIVRGRMAGTQDGGRVVVVPYSALVTVAFNRRMLDAEVEAVFGSETFTEGVSLPVVAAAPAKEAADAAVEEAEEIEEAETPVSAPALPSKTMLLAKLRARLSEGHKK